MPIPRNEEEAERFVEWALSPWREQLIVGKNGPRAILANAIVALRCAPEWAGMLHYDAFATKTMLRGQVPWMEIRQNRIWTPHDDLLATDWLQHNGIIVSPETANLAIETVARDQTYHPVIDYLKSLKWDGVPRLDDWAIKYLGAETTHETLLYIQAISAKFLISAVARVMQPGCKADCVLILEGKQGIRKSTALRMLFNPWFADELAELGTKDAAMQLAGVWCIEMSELDSMKRGDVSKIKAFFARSTDHFRPPWGRRPIDQARQCVFAGTVNDNQYLRDETGARRFWPIACGFIDLDGLNEVRNQLWAEARDRYLAEEIWWLDDERLIAVANVEQETRRVTDPWQEKIEAYVIDRLDVAPAEILAFFGMPDKDQGQLDQNRVAACLRAIGWTRKMIRRDDGAPRRRYVPPA